MNSFSKQYRDCQTVQSFDILGQRCSEAQRLARGVEDLDFFIGDEAMEAKGYAVKVSKSYSEK